VLVGPTDDLFERGQQGEAGFAELIGDRKRRPFLDLARDQPGFGQITMLDSSTSS
jgi:hypothetical protein